MWLVLALLLSTPLGPRTLDRQAVRKVVKKHLPEVFACYEREGKYESRVVLDFTIGKAGRVTSVTPTGGSRTLQTCLAGVFKRMTFPASDAPTRVNYPVQICVAGQ